MHPRAPDGVRITEESCYRYLLRQASGARATLETGLGVSTAVFAGTGAHHTSVFLDPEEGDRFRDWAEAHGVDLANVELLAGGSDHVSPTAVLPDLALVFIDGGHAFPVPIIDRYYACSHLRRGGVVVVVDCQLPAPQRLVEYLDRDPRWVRDDSGTGKKWRAYRREGEGPLSEEWMKQRFLPDIHSGDVRFMARLRQIAALARARLGAVGWRLRRWI